MDTFFKDSRVKGLLETQFLKTVVDSKEMIECAPGTGKLCCVCCVP